MTAWSGRTRVFVGSVIVILVVMLAAQDGHAADKTVTAADWAHATCTAAEKAVKAIGKSIQRGNRALKDARDNSEQRDALSETFSGIASAYERLLKTMDAIGKPTGKNAQKVAAAVREVSFEHETSTAARRSM